MNKYNSLRLNLNEIIMDRDFEVLVLENIRRCAKLSGKSFKAIFWYQDLTEEEIKDFIKRSLSSFSKDDKRVFFLSRLLYFCNFFNIFFARSSSFFEMYLFFEE